MSATTVLHTSICFMILYAKKKSYFQKRNTACGPIPIHYSQGLFTVALLLIQIPSVCS